MQTTSFTHIAQLVDLCVQAGITQVVLSPGSRNAPLIIAFDEHPNIQTFLIHDERVAAFFALGLAESSKKPVAICCTSGSAPLNYAPALSEAYYRNIPLLVLTADRPTALIDQGDGQTIRQKNVFHNYVKAEFELPDFTISNELELSNQIVQKALQNLIALPLGPVHINIPLGEPLYQITESTVNSATFVAQNKTYQLTEKELALIKSEWIAAEKKLILIGQMNFDQRLQQLIEIIGNDPSVAILVENTSNIQKFDKIVHCLDRTLALISEDEIDTFKPDLLITIGGAIISKKIKTFFRVNKPKLNWRVGIYSFEEDTYQSLTSSFVCSPINFFEVVESIEYLPDSNFGNKWKQKDFIAAEKHSEFIKQSDFSDLKVFDWILDTMPESANLHMGNSSVVRYCQLFNPIKSVRYFSNRGVSGIDGSTSTAAGTSFNESSKLNLLISGDISFLYDSNGLWNNYLSPNFRIIVVNNGGGGIFQILEGSNTVKQAHLFFAQHKANIESLCKTFDLNYYHADSVEALNSIVQDFYAVQHNQRPSVLEVKTFSANNSAILKSYFESIRCS